MCTVSVITDYGRSIPLDQWTPVRLEEFKRLVERAKAFDAIANQPDCEDPEKAKWLEVVETSVAEIKSDV
jgi:hypothetical protein